jgi:hypothetical protein
VSSALPDEAVGRPVPLPVSVVHGEVLRLLGYPEGREPQGRIAQTIDEAIVEARGLVRARGIYLRLPAERAADAGLTPEAATSLALGLVTAGAAIEARSAGWTAQGEMVRGLALDAAGSACAEEAADRLCSVILAEGETACDASRVSCRVSPGYGDWPLSAQSRLFALLPHAEIGVRLLPSLMMLPRKSISFAMWLGEDGLPVPGLSGCDACPLERCGFRRGRRA